MSYSSLTNPLHTYVHNGGKTNTRNFEFNKDLNDYFPNKIIYPKKLYSIIPREWIPHKKEWKEFIIPPTNQGSCGSCWGYSVANTLTDRYNIWSKKKIVNGLSPFLILNCNIFATFFKNQKIVNEIDYETWNKETGCYGNILLASILYTYFFGLPTIECFPYDIEDIRSYKEQHTNFSFFEASNSNINLKNHTFNLKDFNKNELTPSCAFATQAQSSPFQYCQNLINVNKYKTYGSIVQNFSITHFYSIEKDEKQIQLEILSNGPVISAFLVYDDFYQFDPKKSIYIHTDDGSNPTGGHAVEIIGWGEENGIKYWWIKNTWGVEYGIDGYFRLLRGYNMCHIEQNVHGFFPDLFIDYTNYKKINQYQNYIKKYKYLKQENSPKFIELINTILNYLINFEHQRTDKKKNFYIKEYYEKYNSFSYPIILRSSLFFLYYSNNYLSSHSSISTTFFSDVVQERLPIDGYKYKVSRRKSYIKPILFLFLFIFFIYLFIIILI